MYIFILISCSTKDEPESKIGDTWTYLYTDFNEHGYVVTSDTFTLYGYSKQPDNRWVNMQYSEDENSHPPYGVYRIGTNGLYRELCNLNECKTNLYLKYPGIKNETYISYSWGSTPTHYTQEITRIISTDTNITVPFGNINHLYLYESRWGDKLRSKIWFSESVWFINYESWDANTYGTGVYKNYSYELISYQPG